MRVVQQGSSEARRGGARVPHWGWLIAAAAIPAPAIAQVPAAPVESAPVESAPVESSSTAPVAETQELSAVDVEASVPSADEPTEGYVSYISRGATKTDTPLMETPQVIDIVTRDQITDQGSLTINQALRYTPGVFTGLSGASSRQTVAALRGFPGGDVNNTFLEGIRLQNNPATYSNIEIDPFFLERIDVVKGPSSVLYGRAQPGGLINYGIKRPQPEQQGTARVYGGSFSTVGGGIDYTDALPDPELGSFRIVANAEGSDTQYDVVERERYTIMPSVNLNLSDDTELLLFAYLQHEPEGGFHGSVPYDISVNDNRFGRTVDEEFVDTARQYENFDRNFAIGSYELAHEVNDHVSLVSKAQYTSLDTELAQIYQTGFTAAPDDGATLNRFYSAAKEDLTAIAFDNHAQFDFDTGGVTHKLLTGFGFQNRNTRTKYQTFNPDLGVTTLDPFDPDYSGDPFIGGEPELAAPSSLQTRQVGLYVQDQLEYQDVHLTLSGRQDFLERENIPAAGETAQRNDDAFTGRVALLYESAIGLSPYASYSEGFNPTAFTTDANNDLPPPVESHQYEVGLKYQPRGINALFTLALYDLTQKNVQQRTAVTPIVFSSVGDINSQGVELSAKGDINDNLHVIAGYSYQDIEYDQAVNSSSVTAAAGNRPTRTPDQLASLWVNYDFPKQISAGIGGRYVGESYADAQNTLTVPDYALADVMLAADLGAWSNTLDGATLRVNANNVLGKEYVEACFNPTYCYYGQARQVIATLNYSF